MHKWSKQTTSKYGKLINKRNYQYLGLLGISLFSLSLSQMQPVNAHADAIGEQTETVASSSSQSSQSSVVKPSAVSTTNTTNTGEGDSSNSSSNIQNKPSTPTSTAKVTSKIGSRVISSSDDNEQKANTPSKPVSKEGLAKTSVPASAMTPDVTTPSNLVVVKNGDSSVQLDNKLKLSVDQTPTLGDVTATDSDNFTYDEGTQTATITDPTATDAVTAEYKNVGTYQGKAISAQVTIANILKHTDEHPVPNSNLTADQVQLTFMPYFGGGIKTYNVGQDEVTIKFFDESGNQITINGDGYITVGSLNGPSTSTAGNEYINYDNANTSTYITEDSVVKYQTNPLTNSGNAYVGVTNDFADVLGAPTSENGAVTFQLSGNAFTFLSGTTRYSLKNANQHWSYTLTTFSSATVAPAVIPTPILSVDKNSAKAGDTVNYTLNQQVNVLGEDTMLRYQSWSEAVTLPTEVSYQQASLLDSRGAVVSAATFAWDAKTHQLTVTLPEDYLQNTMALNGETYQIKIGTIVNNGVVNGEVGPASGQVRIDNGSKASNGVSTVYVAPVVSVPVTMKTMIVHYYKNGTTEKLAPDKTFEVVDGQSYVAPDKSIKGYKVSSQIATSGTYSGQSDATYYYLSEKYKLTINYINEDTSKVISRTISERQVGDSYGIPILNLEVKNNLFVLWNDLKAKLNNRIMPDHDVVINVNYSGLKFNEYRKGKYLVIWGVDTNGTVRYLEQQFSDGASKTIYNRISLDESAKYLFRSADRYTVVSYNAKDQKTVTRYLNGNKLGFLKSGDTFATIFSDGKFVNRLEIRGETISIKSGAANDQEIGRNKIENVQETNSATGESKNIYSFNSQMNGNKRLRSDTSHILQNAKTTLPQTGELSEHIMGIGIFSLLCSVLVAGLGKLNRREK